MKNIILMCLFLFVKMGVSAQNFEGIVTYKNLYKSKIPDLTDQQLTQALGSMQQYLIKEGNYKTKSNGTLLRWQIYKESDTKLYTKMSNAQELTVTDVTNLKDSVISIKLNKGAYNYLGTVCDELVIVSKEGVQKLYFNSTILKVDAEKFKGFKFNNWYTYLTYANALPVRILIDNDKFTLDDVRSSLESIKEQVSAFPVPNYLEEIIKKKTKKEMTKLFQKQVYHILGFLNRDAKRFIQEKRL